ncbi:hypothetical protein [Spongorhabdus nitratireducens]
MSVCDMPVEAVGKAIRMSGWPLVQLEFVSPASEADLQQWLAEMDQMLNEGKRFGLLVSARPNSQLSPEGRKNFSLWFKQNRALLAEGCAGVVRMTANEEEGNRIVSDRMKQAMPFPMIAETCDHRARKWLQFRLQA